METKTNEELMQAIGKMNRHKIFGDEIPVELEVANTLVNDYIAAEAQKKSTQAMVSDYHVEISHAELRIDRFERKQESVKAALTLIYPHKSFDEVLKMLADAYEKEK
jgi:hypothetical protein